ncbi:hypothetical protein SteCoe_22517 [Stentor coeruleus]|uniref:Uncharacterized protein n=1 Tax=Stentor coeruleus TaxID=5963 RepID=A0A1R2BLV2_9CILI|nr:hypothetical protein SteCoe_22517 [Stentor coeruleus]
MGQKHVRFLIEENEPHLSFSFKLARKKNEKNEFRHFENSKNDSEDSVPYPSSLSDQYEDSDSFPNRKVKIKRYKGAKTWKHSRNFKEKIKKFEKQEYSLVRSFTEHRVKFEPNIQDLDENSEFKLKVKMFEKNESRICLLRSRKDWDRQENRMNTSLSLKKKYKKQNSRISTMQSFRSVLIANIPDD